MTTKPLGLKSALPPRESPARALMAEAARAAGRGAACTAFCCLLLALTDHAHDFRSSLPVAVFMSILGACGGACLWLAGLWDVGPPLGGLVPLAGRRGWLVAGAVAGLVVATFLSDLAGRPRLGLVVLGSLLGPLGGAVAALGYAAASVTRGDPAEVAARCRESGSDRLALACLTEAIRLEPRCAIAHRERARRLSRLWSNSNSWWGFGGRRPSQYLGAALADLDAAIAIEPSAADYAERAALLLEARSSAVLPADEEGETAEDDLRRARYALSAAALSDLDEAVRLEPGSAAHRHARGLLRAEVDDEGALDDLREAVRLDPRNPRHRSDLADALRARGEADAAIAEYAAALALDPKYNPALCGRSRAYRDKGDLAAADADDARAERLTRFF